MRSAELMKEFLKTIVELDDSPPFKDFIESSVDFTEKAKAIADSINEETDAKVKNAEQELERMKKLIKVLEEYHAEL